MNPLSDDIVNHLRTVAELPDFSGSRYSIEQEIGRGGMGIVYRAMDHQLKRKVAVKVLNTPDMTGEACIIASLQHPGIVPIYDAGTLPDGRAFYAMKLIEGCQLNHSFAAETSFATRLQLFQKICEAVAFAHHQGIAHLDLKPSNIMVGAFGEAYIMDWGVARKVTSVESAIAGTPSFMAPEQSVGRGCPLSDIYALGAILSTLSEHIAPPVAAISKKAMSESMADRYSSASELSADIGRYLEGMPVRAHHENPLERLTRWASHNSTLLLLVLAYVLVRLTLLFLRFL